jgi:hypothetical protein
MYDRHRDSLVAGTPDAPNPHTPDERAGRTHTILLAAERGWAVTLRFALLLIIDRTLWVGIGYLTSKIIYAVAERLGL